MMIHKKVREIRMSKGLKQTFVARQLGISIARYNAIEKGNRPLRVEFIPKIAEILGVSPMVFFEDHLNESFNEQRKEVIPHESASQTKQAASLPASAP
jgi:transcriptional regulator with XRE-family HTH domain